MKAKKSKTLFIGGKMEVKLEKVDMITNTIIPIIEKFRYAATYTIHPESYSEATEPQPCSDKKIAEFINKLANGADKAELIISNIEWIEYNNCEGDNLYPVIMRAIKLPDGRYFIEIEYYDDDIENDNRGLKRDQYILEWE